MKKIWLTLLVLTGVVGLLWVGTRSSYSSDTSGSDTLAYRLDSISHMSPDSLVSIRVLYPVFEKNRGSVDHQLNEKVEQVLTSLLFSEYSAGKSLKEQMGDQFTVLIAEHANSGYTLPWFLHNAVEVVANSRGVLSLGFSAESFTGGAHGNSAVHYLSMRRKGNSYEEITLDHLLHDDDRLIAVAESLFRVNREIDPSEDLTNAGFWFENGTFSLTDNFAVTPKGLLFYYNSYTIAPYSLGATAIEIPIESFYHLLSQDCENLWAL